MYINVVILEKVVPNLIDGINRLKYKFQNIML